MKVYERLEPKGGLEHLKVLYGTDSVPELYSHLRDGFRALQSRSHVLLRLVTIYLTIADSSGPSIRGFRNRFESGDGRRAVFSLVCDRMLARRHSICSG